jgi:hypothetical protein
VPFPYRRELTALAIALVALAIIGYLAGHGQARSKVREQALTTSVAGVILNVPPDWQPVANTPPIPGFSLTRTAAIAPDGEQSKAGLLAGELGAGEVGPLPKAMLDELRGLPAADVVSLLEAQAYRYQGFELPGYADKLAIYVVPNPGGAPTELACYAAPAVAAYLQTCQHVVETLTLSGRSQSYDLTPQSSYASGLSSAIAALERARLALRREMSSRTSPSTMARLASRLAQHFGRAAASVSSLEPTLATGQAQSALAGAILQARAAYGSLAAAASAGSEARFATARARVARAESAVDEGLARFTLLGYRQA